MVILRLRIKLSLVSFCFFLAFSLLGFFHFRFFATKLWVKLQEKAASETGFKRS